MHERREPQALSPRPERAVPDDRRLPPGFDGRVLLAIRQLDDSAYGPDIARAIERDAGKSISRGALYTALDRLERKGWVRGCIEDPTDDRGGLPRRRFEPTSAAGSGAGS